MKQSYLIIEDNLHAAENLKICMKKHTDYECIGIVKNIKEAKSVIFGKFPKLIFLDVELGDENGFSLLKDLRMELSVFPLVIMTTAHDHYAKEALNNEVLYFLSKPVDPDELNVALLRFVKTMMELKTHIVIKDHQKGHRFLHHDEIIYLNSDNNYTKIFLKSKELINTSKTLGKFEDFLPKQFVRIHRSYIMNTKNIHTIKLNDKKIYYRNDNTQENFIDSDENSLPIGDNYVENLKNLIF